MDNMGMRDYGFDFEIFRPIPGHGSTLSEMKMPFLDFSSMLDQIFVVEDDSNVVRVIELYDLEKQDVDVTVEDRTITVKGEYGTDLDATRVYEQFPEPEGMYLKSTHFVKRGGSNKLVLIFDQVSDEDGIRD